MARTAVVAGTATAVSNRVSRRQAERWAEQDTALPGPAPVAPPAEPSYAAELRELAQLRDQGVISPEDYEGKKRQLLGL